MNKSISELYSEAKESLSGNWPISIAIFLVFLIFSGSNQYLAEEQPSLTLLSLLIGGPLSLGSAIVALTIARGGKPSFEQFFSGFNNYVNATVAYILVVIFTILWMLLFIIPGIIKSIAYSQTFFIMADNPEISPMDAIEKSMEMMDGHKMDYFLLCLTYIGLAILCVLTLGIGFLWFFPFVYVTTAKFYDDIKGDKDLKLTETAF